MATPRCRLSIETNHGVFWCGMHLYSIGPHSIQLVREPFLAGAMRGLRSEKAFPRRQAVGPACKLAGARCRIRSPRRQAIRGGWRGPRGVPAQAIDGWNPRHSIGIGTKTAARNEGARLPIAAWPFEASSHGVHGQTASSRARLRRRGQPGRRTAIRHARWFPDICQQAVVATADARLNHTKNRSGVRSVPGFV